MATRDRRSVSYKLQTCSVWPLALTFIPLKHDANSTAVRGYGQGPRSSASNESPTRRTMHYVGSDTSGKRHQVCCGCSLYVKSTFPFGYREYLHA
ncbi:hypothetical protein M378DRAFT_160728 [Amanita muscaria Koide BX008]|uniref:Uncharacterized protein n=1 Tax=Amanita muscaria (strain Koide BX008) TaxID=946122 RepID=A0A0C2STK1_AMAMK|nr:hypothetical protein M378DRAFT_160728 [Amanita muscaria Koide BX008]